MKRISWKNYFMDMAILTSKRSPCKRLNVGCVLIKNNRLISAGYNGFLSGAKHESIVRNNHEQMIIHAEVNAITDCAKRGVNSNDSIAYITHYPCINCFKTLISAGINEIIYKDDYKNDELVNKLSKDLNIPIIKY